MLKEQNFAIDFAFLQREQLWTVLEKEWDLSS